MTDPRDHRSDPSTDDARRSMRGGFREDNVLADSRTGVSMWAWMAGIVAAVLIVAIIYGFTNRDSQTAGGGNVPPATTGSTTGQGGGTGSGPSGSGGATTSGSGTTAPGQGAR